MQFAAAENGSELCFEAWAAETTDAVASCFGVDTCGGDGTCNTCAGSSNGVLAEVFWSTTGNITQPFTSAGVADVGQTEGQIYCLPGTFTGIQSMVVCRGWCAGNTWNLLVDHMCLVS
jgi:hypothetical protein